MLSLSKQVAGVKTTYQLEQEADVKQQLLAEQAIAENKAKQAATLKLAEKSDAEIEEDEQR